MKQISAFDLDHTLVRSNSSALFYRYLVSKGFYRQISLIWTALYSLRHHFLSLSLSKLHQLVFEKFLKGVPLHVVQREVARFLKKDFYQFLYLPTFSRLRWAQHQGHHTVILSNGPSFLVGPIAHYLGVSEWHSSQYAVNSKGYFESVESVLLGEGKAHVLERIARKLNSSWDFITAYSDSDLDLPLLYSAGTPVAVNPNTKLLEISKKNYWEVI